MCSKIIHLKDINKDNLFILDELRTGMEMGMEMGMGMGMDMGMEMDINIVKEKNNNDVDDAAADDVDEKLSRVSLGTIKTEDYEVSSSLKLCHIKIYNNSPYIIKVYISHHFNKELIIEKGREYGYFIMMPDMFKENWCIKYNLEDLKDKNLILPIRIDIIYKKECISLECNRFNHPINESTEDKEGNYIFTFTGENFTEEDLENAFLSMNPK